MGEHGRPLVLFLEQPCPEYVQSRVSAEHDLRSTFIALLVVLLTLAHAAHHLCHHVVRDMFSAGCDGTLEIEEDHFFERFLRFAGSQETLMRVDGDVCLARTAEVFFTHVFMLARVFHDLCAGRTHMAVLADGLRILSRGFQVSVEAGPTVECEVAVQTLDPVVTLDTPWGFAQSADTFTLVFHFRPVPPQTPEAKVILTQEPCDAVDGVLVVTRVVDVVDRASIFLQLGLVQDPIPYLSAEDDHLSIHLRLEGGQLVQTARFLDRHARSPV